MVVRRRAATAGVMVALTSLAATAADDAVTARPLQSGRAVGKPVPSFYVRAVTGPLRDKSVCYVCRNGDRPVVMILMQRLDTQIARLLKDVDGIVDHHRATGLRAFGVLVAEQPVLAISKVQTLAFNEQIGLPLTVGTTVIASPSCQDLHPEAAVTVVLYRRQRVISTHGFRPGELSDDPLRDLLACVRRLADDR